MLTPSQKRAKAGSSAGLSELSKQLRILQAKNESQAVDINRLERQLRILADLQGISKFFVPEQTLYDTLYLTNKFLALLET
jgi:hypothetical protein